MDFPIEEYRRRLERTQAEMAKHNLPALLLHGPENICYLSGFYTSTGFFSYHALVVPPKGDPVLIVRDMEEPAAQDTSWVTDRFVYADTTADPLTAAQRAITSLGLDAGRIGIEHHSWFLTLERYHALRRLLPLATFVQEPRLVDHLRLVKSPLEIAYMRTGARIVEAAMRAGVDAITPGASERDLAEAIIATQVRAGSEGPFGGVITSGSRTHLIHGGFTDRRLRKGDHIYYELSAVVNHYWTRLMRTATCGTSSHDQERTAEVLLTAQDAAISRMRPGVLASEVDDACREPVLRANLRESYTNRTGYSLGLVYRPSAGEFIREFLPKASWRLEAGLVFHMLLMARGIGFSETVLVTENDPELLTHFERRLLVR